ncbi:MULTISPECIES: AfsR/SARP family transcriptional regulator [unclassified Nocardia]|uniref:AfsR/SARP family transcriptional regulator n=2 Tax=Nocardia TaxID=1817 RepID=UPI00278BB441|nr:MULTISPECIES: AfsR/SARP family transcriptional regulator [unclassified Nocardia]
MALSLSWDAPASTTREDTLHTGAIQVEILGAVSLAAGGNRAEVRAEKIRAMLAALTLKAGNTVYYNELAEELWPGELLKNPRNAIQAQATRIRKMIDKFAHGFGEPATLRAVQNGYVLEIPRDAVDANRFLDHVARGFSDLTVDPARALRSLQHGLQLWRGPALLDTLVGERCRSAAAFLEEQRTLAQEDLVSAYLLLGNNRQATVELQRLIAAAPSRERVCELLMLALYRTGRQSEALHLFHRTRQRLDAELGVEPGRALSCLYESILAQDSALDTATAVLRRAEAVHPALRNRLTA